MVYQGTALDTSTELEGCCWDFVCAHVFGSSQWGVFGSEVRAHWHSDVLASHTAHVKIVFVYNDVLKDKFMKGFSYL